MDFSPKRETIPLTVTARHSEERQQDQQWWKKRKAVAKKKIMALEREVVNLPEGQEHHEQLKKKSLEEKKQTCNNRGLVCVFVGVYETSNALWLPPPKKKHCFYLSNIIVGKYTEISVRSQSSVRGGEDAQVQQVWSCTKMKTLLQPCNHFASCLLHFKKTHLSNNMQSSVSQSTLVTIHAAQGGTHPTGKMMSAE